MSADLPGPWRPTHSFVPPPGLPVWVWGKGGKWGNIQVAWVVETRHGWKWGDGVVIREPSMFPAWCFLYELPVPDFAETKYKKGEPMPVDQPAPDAVARMPKWKRDYLSRCFGVSMENEKEAPAPDALAALREAMTKSADVDWETHDLRYGSLAQRLLPALLDELERRRADSGLLGNLLAVIHRDGGHRQSEAGTTRTVAEAAEKVAGWIHADGWRPIDPERPETWPEQGVNFDWWHKPHSACVVGQRLGQKQFFNEVATQDNELLPIRQFSHWRLRPAAPAGGGRGKA